MVGAWAVRGRVSGCATGESRMSVGAKENSSVEELHAKEHSFDGCVRESACCVSDEA